jgi:hypothetical protein
MQLADNKSDGLKILPFLSYFVLTMLLVNITTSIVNAFINNEILRESIITYILVRLLFFFILLYIYVQIKLLLKNRLNRREIIIKLINRFRILGLLFIAWDIIKFSYWFFVSFNNIKHLALCFANMGWNHAVYGIVFLSLAEIISIAAKLKEENDLTV